MVYLNMLIMLWTLDDASIKILISFCWHIKAKGFYSGHFGYLFVSLHESENTDHSHKKSF